MKQVTFEGTVDTYASKPVDPPIKYSGTADQYENVSEAKSSEDWLGESEILKTINTKKLTAAKAGKYQEVTKTLKAAYENSWEYKRKNMVDSAIAMGLDRASAEAFADSTPEAAKQKSAA